MNATANGAPDLDAAPTPEGVVLGAEERERVRAEMAAIWNLWGMTADEEEAIVAMIERIITARVSPEVTAAYDNGLTDHQSHDCCTGRAAAALERERLARRNRTSMCPPCVHREHQACIGDLPRGDAAAWECGCATRGHQ